MEVDEQTDLKKKKRAPCRVAYKGTKGRTEKKHEDAVRGRFESQMMLVLIPVKTNHNRQTGNKY